MASGMDGLSGGSSISSFDQSIQSQDSSGDSGSLLGFKVSTTDALPTAGLKKVDTAEVETQTEPPAKKLAMRTVKKADKGVVASIKQKASQIKSKAKHFGRVAIKALVHKLHVIKRALFKENFQPVSDAASSKMTDKGRKNIDPMVKEFNQGVTDLNAMKGKMVALADKMMAFAEEYSDELAVMDDSSVVLKESGPVRLSIPVESERVEILAPIPGNKGDREQAVKDFQEMFGASSEFQDYKAAQKELADIKDKRDALKSDLKTKRDEMLGVFKEDLKGRMDAKRESSMSDIDSSKTTRRDNMQKGVDSLKEDKEKGFSDSQFEVDTSRAILESLDDLDLNP